jgi:hypothetical protein
MKSMGDVAIGIVTGAHYATTSRTIETARS